MIQLLSTASYILIQVFRQIMSNCANYNITLKMNCSKEAQLRGSIPNVSQELAKQIRLQLEYYFSIANLATDQHLKRMIESNNRGWVQIKDLLQFKRLKQLIARSFEKTLTLKQIQQLIGIVLQDSQKLTVMKGQIKLKKHLSWHRELKKVLYFEGENLSKDTLINLLASHSIPQQNVTIREGSSWYFVQFSSFDEQQVNSFYEDIKISLLPEQKLKIMKMDEFKQYQKKFNQLFHLQNQLNTKTTIHVPPRQLLQYDEIEVKVSQKIAKESISDKTVDYEKIFSKYIKSRNKKTPQAYEKHRAEKIAFKKQQKALKQSQNGNKMEVQQ